MTTKEKLKKVHSDINKKFGVDVKLFKAGGSWVVTPEKQNVDNKKMIEIREYILLHSEELEEDDE